MRLLLLEAPEKEGQTFQLGPELSPGFEHVEIWVSGGHSRYRGSSGQENILKHKKTVTHRGILKQEPYFSDSQNQF